MPHVFRLSSCSLIITLALSSAANASPSSKNHNDTLKVTGTRTIADNFKHPGVVTVIDASLPQQQTATTATDMLKNVPGVSITGVGRTNGQNVNIRGYDQYGVLVLIDGIRQGIKGTHFNGTFLDPALIKKVSVIRSPSTSLFGSGAMGELLLTRRLMLRIYSQRVKSWACELAIIAPAPPTARASRCLLLVELNISTVLLP